MIVEGENKDYVYYFFILIIYVNFFSVLFVYL